MKAVLIVSAVVVLFILWLPLKMAGICSRQEEQESNSLNGDAYKN